MRPRGLRGGAYGNVVLTRLPILFSANYDISCPGRGPRGCQRLDLGMPDGTVLHFLVYYARGTELVGLELVRNRLALIASDHLPLVADFRLSQGQRRDAEIAGTIF